MRARALLKTPAALGVYTRSETQRPSPYSGSRTPADPRARRPSLLALHTNRPALQLPRRKFAGRTFRAPSVPARSCAAAHTPAVYAPQSCNPVTSAESARRCDALCAGACAVLAIGLQDGVHKCGCGVHLPPPPFRFLPRLRHRVTDGFSHHPSMHPSFLTTPAILPTPELVLWADLLKQLHFASPVQRVPSARAQARIRVPVRLSGGPKHIAELGQLRIPKSPGSGCRVWRMRSKHRNRTSASGI